MGVVYRGTCPHCGYTRRFFLGGGLMSVNLEMSMEALTDQEREDVRGIVDRQEIRNFHVENYMVECRGCSELTTKTIIQITGQDGKQRIFGQKCSHCGKPVKIYWENAEATLKCPDCHKGVVGLEETGLWD